VANTISSYLAAGRLADVLALIQLLAFDDSGYRTEEGMQTNLGAKPKSAASWTDIGRAHPEFFRVRDESGRSVRVALIIRYIVGKIDVGGEDKRPPLATEFAASLFQLAVNLHDKQVQHRDRWKPWLFGFLGAALGAIATIGGAYLQDGGTEPTAVMPPITIQMPPALPDSRESGR
jgi:hypothetical protein